MKRLSFLITLLIFFSTLYGQEYFNLIIPFDYVPAVDNLIDEGDRVKISILHFLNDNTSTSIVDHNMLNHENSYSSAFYGFRICPNGFQKHNDQYFSYGDNILDVNEFHLSIYDNNLSLLNTKKFSSNADYSKSQNFIISHNLLFTINIEDYNVNKPAYHRELLFRKYDLLGNKLFEKTLFNDNKLTFPWDIVTSLDSKLVLSHKSVTFDFPYGVPQLTKIDTNGLIIWECHGEERLNNGATPVWLASLSDSTFVQSYEIDKNFDPIFLQNDWDTTPTKFRWINGNGDSISESILVVPRKHDLHFMQIKKGNGDYFFAYGIYQEDDVDEHYGIIMKFSNNGDTLWMHKYQHPEYTDRHNDTYHYIFNILERDNGDIIALGEIWPSDEINNKVWLFKVNKYGCYGSDSCDANVIYTEVETLPKKFNIKLFPNPVNQELTILLNNQEKLYFQILNQQGYLIDEFDIKGNNFPIKKSVIMYPPGIYYLSIFNQQNIFLGTTKFIKN
jgi:hypothetical protein